MPTFENLKKKIELASKDPRLVEIAKNAPPVKNDKYRLNLTWVYDKAFEYALEQIHDIKKSRELATSTRFLAMLRRDYPILFEELLKTQTRQPEPEKETAKEIPEQPKKKFEEIELEIPNFVELITTESIQSHYTDDHICYTVPLKKRLMKFPNEYSWSCVWAFCLNLLDKMVVRELSRDPNGGFKKIFTNDLDEFIEKNFGPEPLIEILEKRGLKIKICGNCRDYNKCLGKMSGQLLDKFYGCEIWHSKEIPEEKKN